MVKKENNYAFIDGQNLNLGIQELGWKLDYYKFRQFLKNELLVTKAYYFIGKISTNQVIYDFLLKVGFTLDFKETIPDGDGNIKGNIDANLVLKTIVEIDNYDKAVIVTNDGDFHCLIKHLKINGKLKNVVSPNQKCAKIIKKEAEKDIIYLDGKKDELQYTKIKKAP